MEVFKWLILLAGLSLLVLSIVRQLKIKVFQTPPLSPLQRIAIFILSGFMIVVAGIMIIPQFLPNERSLGSTSPQEEENPSVKLPSKIVGMVPIPAGKFMMGSNDGNDDEKPVHTVIVAAFFIDTHEVTVGQYRGFVKATGYKKPDWNKVTKFSPTDNHPMIYVSWYDAMAYAIWASKRLPTEAEWEYAARAGSARKKYPWGDSIDKSKANYNMGVGKTTPVGTYPPNGYGLYDIAGNVWEWCLDEYDEDFYKKSAKEDSIAGEDISIVSNNFTSVKTARVLRGGSWYGSFNIRVANRGRFNPDGTYGDYGFRCVVPCVQ